MIMCFFLLYYRRDPLIPEDENSPSYSPLLSKFTIKRMNGPASPPSSRASLSHATAHDLWSFAVTAFAVYIRSAMRPLESKLSSFACHPVFAWLIYRAKNTGLTFTSIRCSWSTEKGGFEPHPSLGRPVNTAFLRPIFDFTNFPKEIKSISGPKY